MFLMNVWPRTQLRTIWCATMQVFFPLFCAEKEEQIRFHVEHMRKYRESWSLWNTYRSYYSIETMPDAANHSSELHAMQLFHICWSDTINANGLFATTATDAIQSVVRWFGQAFAYKHQWRRLDREYRKLTMSSHLFKKETPAVQCWI